MRKYFFTGLAVLLPAVLTLLILGFLINIITAPFIHITQATLSHYDILNQPIFFLSADTALLVSSRILILISLILAIILIGFLGKLFLVRWFGRLGDYLLHRTPLINKIYKTLKDITHTLLGEEEQVKFSSVVLVPFPHLKGHSIGLVTNKKSIEGNSESVERISVFVPGTPNPTMGFMLLYDKTQVIPLSLAVEDALKLIISCGAILPEELQGNPADVY